MNTTMLAGNLASDVTVRALANDKHVGRFTLAVDRGYKRDAGTDFYRVTVWNGAATNAEKHLRKGDSVIVRGHLRTSSYEKPCEGCGKAYTVWVTEIHADDVTYGARARRNSDRSTAPAGRGR